MATKNSDTKKVSANQLKCACCDANEPPPGEKFKVCTRCRLVHYCNKQCQASHWKNGHKKFCVKVEERKPSSSSSDNIPSEINNSKKENCPICLENIETSPCSLPCQHIFHLECIKQLRSHASSQVCPLCRADLPPGPEKTFIEGCSIRHQLNKSLTLRGGSMNSPLSNHEKELSIQMVKLWTQSAQEGYIQSIYNLGIIHRDGSGVSINLNKSFQWFQQGAELGHVQSQICLAMIYEDDKFESKNVNKAFYWHEKSAKQNYAKAEYNFGQCHLFGKGCKQSYESAAIWFLKAARQGYKEAQANYANMLVHGYGVKPNIKEAVMWYTKASNMGDALAQASLAGLYMSGQGVGQNIELAIYWYEKAAYQNDLDAQEKLAIIYSQIKPNKQKASIFHLMAAKNGSVTSQVYLSEAYMYGQVGLEKNEIESAKWTRKAAERGHHLCQCNLGLFLKTGMYGEKKDLKQAMFWFEKSAKQGNGMAKAKYAECLKLYSSKGF